MSEVRAEIGDAATIDTATHKAKRLVRDPFFKTPSARRTYLSMKCARYFTSVRGGSAGKGIIRVLELRLAVADGNKVLGARLNFCPCRKPNPNLVMV